MQAHDLLTTDAKLIFELAARMDPPEVLAEKYGLDPDYLLEMVETPHVKRMVADKRAELESQGFVLAQKAKLMFEDLLPDIYRRAKKQDVTLSGVLEAAKFFRSVAGLDKVESQANAGSRFSITINLPSPGAPAAQAITIDVDTAALDQPPSYIPRVAAPVCTDLAYE